MPLLAPHDYNDDLVAIAQQISLSSSEDYLDELIPVIKDARYNDRTSQLMHALTHASAQYESEIKQIGSRNYKEFVDSVGQLRQVREGCKNLTMEVLDLNESIHQSIAELAKHKQAIVDCHSVRRNIDEASRALRACLDVLSLANQVHQLLNKKNNYAALRALDELRNVHLREIHRFKIAEMVEESVPATQQLISENVIRDLYTWLYRLRELSPGVGEKAFDQTRRRQARQRERASFIPELGRSKLNSAMELVADEDDDFDPMLNDDIQVVFTPLLECIHIQERIGLLEFFRAEYAATRRRQMELLLPASIILDDEENADLCFLLHGIAGFAIIERETMKLTYNFRSSNDVEDLWENMCHSAVALITNALQTIDNDEMLLKIKDVLTLFIHTMTGYDYSYASFFSLFFILFEKYSNLLKKRFGDDLQEIVSTDGYMPMTISSADQYEKVINVSFYKPEASGEELVFPCVLPFSQMYPLCCIDVRNFLHQIYLFSRDLIRYSSIMDGSVQKTLNELLCDKVYKLLLAQLSSQYPGQIVQIFTNLGHFEEACVGIEAHLNEVQSPDMRYNGPAVLEARELFRSGKKTAEKRIFELVNSKIDALIETAEYDWLATTPSKETSAYMQTLTRYLSNIMNSVLLGLPAEIKELIYFDALGHTAATILGLPLDSEVHRITPAAVKTLALDIDYLYQFVQKLDNPILEQNLDELLQTIALLQTDKHEEFYDVAQRNRKYGRVDREQGAILVEKVVQGAAIAQSPTRSQEKFSTISSRFGMGK